MWLNVPLSTRDICYLLSLLTEIALIIGLYWWKISRLFCWHMWLCSEHYHKPDLSCLEQARWHDTIESSLYTSIWEYKIPNQWSSKKYGGYSLGIQNGDPWSSNWSQSENIHFKKSERGREKLCHQNGRVPQQV